MGDIDGEASGSAAPGAQHPTLRFWQRIRTEDFGFRICQTLSMLTVNYPALAGIPVDRRLISQRRHPSITRKDAIWANLPADK